MAENDRSIPDLIRTAIRDAEDLVRAEIALAKAELREEGRRLGLGAALLAGAAIAAMLSLVLLLTTAAWALAGVLGWPVWIGFAAVTAVTLLAAAVLWTVGRRKITAGPHFQNTTETLKENARWIRARTS